MPRFVCLLSVFAALVGAQPRDPGKGVNFYSIEREIALGRQLAGEFRRDARPLESPAALAYVDGIGRRLAAQIGGPPFPYTFALVADDPTVLHEVKSFPGGFLFVPAPLILAAKDEDELTGMLARAVAHVAFRDWTRQTTRAELMRVANEPMMTMAGSTGSAIAQGQAIAIPAGFAQISRRFELDADRAAARAMSAAGYDPEALARYIDREQAAYDEHSQAMFSPMPTRAKRLEAIRATIAEIPARSYPPHEGLSKIQEEVRRAASLPAK